MLSSLYGAMMVFAALAPGLHLSIAQTTTLCSLMLIAHSLPLELSISRKAGAGFAVMGVFRLTGALVFGFILNSIAAFLHIWQEPASLLFKGRQRSLTLAQWGVEQIGNLLLLVGVIFCIIVIMRLLRAAGVLALLERFLAPVLPFLGMSRQAAPLTVVGMVMGISYGGALIIREATSGRLERMEIFNSLALMGLSHSLVEDTLLMLAMGSSLLGILWGRLLFSCIAIFFLVRVMKRWGIAGGTCG
jgi:spore maturation protein SpmB